MSTRRLRLQARSHEPQMRFAERPVLWSVEGARGDGCRNSLSSTCMDLLVRKQLPASSSAMASGPNTNR